MNCSNCAKQFNDYINGKLPSALISEVDDHLKHCVNCRLLYDALLATDQLISEEKETIPGSGITDKVMNAIQHKNTVATVGTKFQGVFQPLLIAASIVLAVLAGIRVGNLYNTTRPAKQVPVELSLMDDLSLESVDMITRE